MWLPNNVRSQETLSAIQREIARVEKEIQREKKLHKEELDKAAAFELKKAEKIKTIKEQEKAIALEIEDLKAKVSGFKNQIAAQKSQKSLYIDRRAKVSSALVKSIDTLIANTSKDFPSGKEQRIASFTKLKSEIQEGDISPEEGINRLFTSLQNQLNLGYNTEIYSGIHRFQNGKSAEGNFLRIGAVLLYFVSRDGSEIAYLKKKDDGYSWVEENILLEHREKIKLALQIVEGGATPQLGLLPIYQPLFSEVIP